MQFSRQSFTIAHISFYKPTSSFEPLVRTNNTSRCLHMSNTMFWNIEVFEKKKLFYETMDPPSQYGQTLPPKITIMTWIFLLESIYTICRCFHKSYSFSWCFFFEEIFKDFTLTVQKDNVCCVLTYRFKKWYDKTAITWRHRGIHVQGNYVV